MKSGRTLVSLAQELERQLHSKKDLVVPSQLVHHSTGDGGETHLVIDEGGGAMHYGVMPLARRQLADKLKIPYAYFERIVANVGDATLFPPRRDLVALLDMPLPLARPLAAVHAAHHLAS